MCEAVQSSGAGGFRLLRDLALERLGWGEGRVCRGNEKELDGGLSRARVWKLREMMVSSMWGNYVT